MRRITTRQFATACLLAAQAATFDQTPALAAKNRGAPGSSDRADWCRSKLGECRSAADQTCNFTYGGNAAQLEACLDERRNSCEHSYGSSSNCTTAIRPATQIFKNGTLKLQKN